MEQIFLRELHDGALRIENYEIKSETEKEITYKVTYEEIVCGIKGRDTELITIKK